jgi:Zn-finger protein
LEAKCLGCFEMFYRRELVCVGEFSNGRELVLCGECLSIYRSNRLSGRCPEDAVAFILQYRRLHDGI